MKRAGEADALEEDLIINLRRRVSLFERHVLDRIKFCVCVEDIADNSCYTVSFTDGVPVVRRGAEPEEGCLLWLDIPPVTSCATPLPASGVETL